MTASLPDEQISDERVRELLARRVNALGPSNQESGELAGLLVELLQLRAYLAAGPEPEYRWGVREHDGTEGWCDEKHARWLAKTNGWELIRVIEYPEAHVEVVPVETGEAQTP